MRKCSWPEKHRGVGGAKVFAGACAAGDAASKHAMLLDPPPCRGRGLFLRRAGWGGGFVLLSDYTAGVDD